MPGRLSTGKIPLGRDGMIRMSLDRKRWTALSLVGLVLWGWLGGCETLAGRPSRSINNDVVVVGTPHADYLSSEAYNLRDLDAVLRALEPEVVLCQIPPDRFFEAWQQFVDTGRVEEEHVRLFPEYEGVLFPLARQGRLVLRPCSGWTAETAARRDAQLAQWQTTRPQDAREVQRALKQAENRLLVEGLRFDSLRVQTLRFDEIIAEGLKPYERLFDRDLGPGGWGEINQAHFTLISAALDDLAGRGLRVAVVFGAEHKYRLRELLATKKGNRLRRLEEYVQIESPAAR